jgi:uncharacterized membrane protein
MFPTMLRTGLLWVSALPFIHCAETARIPAGQHRGTTPDTTLVYECADGLSFVAALRSDTAWVFLSSGSAALPHVPASSGARYAAGDAVLWMKGKEATLELSGSEAHSCRNNRRRAVWEHAKLSGVAFRAIGNEPGWHVEISADSIRLVSDYGERRTAFPTPEPRTDTALSRTVYRTVSAGDTLEIVLELRPCRDTMSGEAFATSVTLVLGDRTLRGCGRALH